MKKEIMDILCCPNCKGELDLAVLKEDYKEIVTGSLTCKKCNEKFKIEEGIPCLLPK